MKKCKFCGKMIQDGSATCEYCGRELIAPPKPRKIRPAGRNAWLGLGFLLFAFFVSAITNSMTPTTKVQALLPGLIIGLAGWAAIILFIVAIVQAILNRRV